MTFRIGDFRNQIDQELLNLSVPFDQKSKFLPPGQGYYAWRGGYRGIKVATWHSGEQSLSEWVRGMAPTGQETPRVTPQPASIERPEVDAGHLIGQFLGGYRLEEQLGQGGMALVYKAYQASLDRYVAIKVLPAQFTFSPGFAERFAREAKVVAQLSQYRIGVRYLYLAADKREGAVILCLTVPARQQDL